MKVPLSSLSLSALERTYAFEAIETGWISGTGSFIRAFEEELARRIERRHVVAVSSGTTAVELALLGLGIGAGDEVVVPALTFVAPAAMVRAVGATPVFADLDPATWTLDPAHVGRLITERTRAILTVDVLGHPCDYDRLAAFGLPIVEDAAQAHGARYKGRAAGSFGAVSTLSFHANKTIATGEGGCVGTDDEALHERMRLIANHGMTPERPYWHPVLGRNFRMTNVTAAIGLGQVQRWDELVEARRAVAAAYDERLRDLPLTRRPVAPWATEACWLYTVSHPHRARLLDELRGAGIDARAIWTDLPSLPPYRPFVREECPVARRVSETSMWLPTWSFMEEETIDRVAGALNSVLKGIAEPAGT